MKRLGLACALLLLAGCGRQHEKHLVHGVFPLRPDGLEVAFTIEEPTTIECSIGLPMDAKVEMTIGRLLPATRPDLVFVQEDVTKHEIQGPSSVTRVELTKRGAYVLRIPPIPVAMEFHATGVPVRVTPR